MIEEKKTLNLFRNVKAFDEDSKKYPVMILNKKCRANTTPEQKFFPNKISSATVQQELYKITEILSKYSNDMLNY